MNSFSVKQGLKPRQVIQIDSMDEALRNSLWDALTISCWKSFEKYLYHDIDPFQDYTQDLDSPAHSAYKLMLDIWVDFFNYTLDKAPQCLGSFVSIVRTWFLDKALWNHVYDFIEFIAVHDTDPDRSKKFRNECNKVLEKRLSAYRFVGDQIAPVISDVEIKEIEDTESYQGALQTASEHINNAVKSMSNRENPDFPNSISESIKAVESVCRKILGNDNTLGNALNEIIESGVLYLDEHFVKGLRSMYKYTCDSGGIRHSAKDGNVPPELDDAKFMLVFCSATVNYLVEKARKAGINF
jgi:hypothetical protein